MPGVSEASRGVSIVVPAYNEAEAISPTLSRIIEAMAGFDGPCEVVVVDDGSTDGTAESVGNHPGVRLVQHQQNRGYGAALKTGIRRAHHGWIVILDADGTYPPEAIPELLTYLDDYDMVVGARTGDDVRIPLIRRPAKWILIHLANYLSGVSIPDLNSGLRAFKRDIVEPFFRLLPAGFSFTTSITLLMLTNDYNVHYIPTDYHERVGRSKIRPVRDTINFFALVVRVILSYRPLRVMIPLASLFSLLSIVKVIYDIYAYDFHLATSTVVLLTVTFQIIILGFIADLVVSLHKT
jgi:glycosyltransferase involved in cell wall biosynthesis